MATASQPSSTESPVTPGAPLRVYHRTGAGRPIRVVWTLEEVGADYELVTMSVDEARLAEHRARHPLGRVPVVEDEHGPLFESTALCIHISELYPQAGLLPPLGTRERALVQQWSIFAMTELEGPAIEYYRQREENPELAARAAARARDAALAIERALSGSPPRLVGSQLTVADIVAGEVLRMAVRLGAAEPSPTVEAYLDSLLERPARVRAAERLA
jgi:glutathione S-transferase